ncbi:hypothetical protein GWK47_017385 [Chionoecetes opilio]|uniref:Uncharacterized protein n=1 Tax=Chionoecetes opilio TaxID=41210 RepID=A0A8J4XVY5_CHIOP|nr:hypothetical protein GWK47_017385 [Chionoecetes opilio]
MSQVPQRAPRNDLCQPKPLSMDPQTRGGGRARQASSSPLTSRRTCGLSFLDERFSKRRRRHGQEPVRRREKASATGGKRLSPDMELKDLVTARLGGPWIASLPGRRHDVKKWGTSWRRSPETWGDCGTFRDMNEERLGEKCVNDAAERAWPPPSTRSSPRDEVSKQYLLKWWPSKEGAARHIIFTKASHIEV